MTNLSDTKKVHIKSTALFLFSFWSFWYLAYINNFGNYPKTGNIQRDFMTDTEEKNCCVF